ncbi:MAG: tetratricopeptide repeat protein, partial [Methanospirillum sp.]|uniref:tetratricopeptide repeat protein n=1 Tax=Methanospirillum sp. TaxID=45200 RepID=UPI002372CED9
FGKVVPTNANMADQDTAGPHYPTATNVDAKSDQLSLEDLEKQGKGLFALGLYDYAASAYKAAVQKSGSNPEVLATYGNILSGLSRWEEAKNVYNQSLALKQDKDVLNSYGGVLIQLKKYDAALEAFNRSISLEGANPGAMVGSARSYTGLKLTNESADAYKRSLDLDASQPSVWKEYGDALAVINKSSEAITAYEKAISLGVSGADLYIKYGEALRKSGKNGEAEAAMAKGRSMQGALYSSISDSVPRCTAGGAMG